MKRPEGTTRVERILFWTFCVVAVLFTIWIIIFVIAALTGRVGA